MQNIDLFKNKLEFGNYICHFKINWNRNTTIILGRVAGFTNNFIIYIDYYGKYRRCLADNCIKINKNIYKRAKEIRKAL